MTPPPPHLYAVSVVLIGEEPHERMRTKYTQRHDGEGFEIPNLTPYKLACCDCGLVHKIVLAAPGVGKGVGIGFASERDNRATAQRRRTKP